MEAAQVIVASLFFLLRLIGAGYCSNRAIALNRSAGGWAFFGLFFPIIAMILISCLKIKKVWHNDAGINQ